MEISTQQCVWNSIYLIYMIVSSSAIEDIIVDLACNKSPGLDILTSAYSKLRVQH